MNLKLIKQLVKVMKGADVTELEVDDSNSGVKVRIKRGPDTDGMPQPMVTFLPGAGAGMPAAAPAPLVAEGDRSAGDSEPAGPPPGTTPITSPMVGTFYKSPSPEAEAFVEVGTRIQIDSVICIVEAMKVMNEIKSEISGEVVEILVENGAPVEHGQPLFLVKT